MLRLAKSRDADDIRRWRNHADVRAVSLTSHEIGPDEHAAWFAAATSDAWRRVLIYEHGGRPSGVVTFTGLRDGSASWGFFLDLDGLGERGETLPAWLRIGREAIEYAFDDLGLDELTGEVLAHNAVVRQMNHRLGFTETGSRTVTTGGTAAECLSIRLTRAAHEARLAARDRRRAGHPTLQELA